MRKISFILAAAVSALLAIVSCNRNESALPGYGNKAVIRIGAAPQDARESTKTFIDEDQTGTTSVYRSKWSNRDEKLGLVFGQISDKSSPVTLEAEETDDHNPVFTGEAELEDGTYNLFIFYPRSAYEKCYSDGTVGFNLKSTQHPVLGSFDPECDLMGWSTDKAVVADGSYVLDGITLNRAMAILRVNLNAPAGGGKAMGESVGSVTGLKIEVAEGETSSEKVTLTGRAAISSEGEIGRWTIQNNYVEASIDAAEMITIGESEGFQSVYLVVNPTTIPEGRAITFSVETEGFNGANKITRTVTAPAGGMVLEAGKVNTINLTIRDKDFPGAVIEEDYNGYWLITGTGDGKTVAAVAYVSGNNNLKGDAPLVFSEDGSTITSTANLVESRMTFTKVTEGKYSGLYTIQDINGLYLYASSSSGNQLKGKTQPDANAYWSVTLDPTSGKYSIVATESDNRNVMQFNSNSGSPIFACYASASMAPVVLYPWSMVSGVDTTPKITFEETSKDVDASATSVEFTYTKNHFVTELPAVGVSAGSDCINGTVAVTDGKITVPLKANTDEARKTITLTVSGQGIDGSVTLTIVQAAYVPAAALTIKDLNDKIRKDNVTSSGSAKEYSGRLENVIVTGVKGSYAFAEDATGGILLFQVSNLQAGMTASGDATVKGFMYNNMPEVTSFTPPSNIGSTTTIPSTTYTKIADLNAVWQDRMSMRTVLKDVEVTEAFNNRNAKVKDADGTVLAVRDFAASNLVLHVGETVTLTGYPAQYNTTAQFALLDASDIVVTKDVPTISVSPATLVWDAGEYGSGVAKTVTVTQNASATGFSISGEGAVTKFEVTTNSDGTVSVYPREANTSTSEVVSCILYFTHKDDGSVEGTVSLSQRTAQGATKEVTDVVTINGTGVTGGSYATWKQVSGTSGAIYEGKSAASYSSIQLRSTNSDSGVYTRSSKGKVKSIKVTWNSNTTTGRTLNVYAKNTPYTSAADLYSSNSSTRGTLVGTIVKGSSTTLTFADDYNYIGFRSNSGAMYIDKVEIVWIVPVE